MEATQAETTVRVLCRLLESYFAQQEYILRLEQTLIRSTNGIEAEPVQDKEDAAEEHEEVPGVRQVSPEGPEE